MSGGLKRSKNDAEYVFNQTNRERKVVGRGTYNKVRAGGRRVRMPSDNMTKKERAAMNGEVKSYNMGRPIEWAVFRDMPKQMQEQYVIGLQQKFPGISGALIAEAVGTKPNTFNPYLLRHGLKFDFRNGMDRRAFFKTEHGERFLDWMTNPVASREVEEKPVPAVPAPSEVEVSPGEPVADEPVKKIVAGPGMDINNIAVLLSSLVGTGAKLTIEISL